MKRTRIKSKRTRFRLPVGWVSVLEWKHNTWGYCTRRAIPNRRKLLNGYRPHYRGELVGHRNEKGLVSIKYRWDGNKWVSFGQEKTIKL